MKTIESKQTAVITGAGTGIGYAVAERLLNDGFNVVLNGRSENKLKAAATQLGRADRIAISAGDITEPQTADRLIAESIQRFAGIDVLVNNAGIFATKPLTDYTVEELDRYLGYLRGTFLLTQSAVRRMRIQGRGGAIVNISTILAFRGVAAFPSSAPMAAKGGITALTQNLAVELAADDIRINAVAPGVVPTPLYGELTGAQLEALHEMQPLGRYGTPGDIADAVAYLAKAKWVTGVILPVDGGVQSGGDGTSRKPARQGSLGAAARESRAA